MGVKLTSKNETATATPITAAATAAAIPATKKMVTLQGKKIVPTSGVFMISSPDGKYKYIGVSTRIEVCVKDYMKWLADGKHGNVEMQTAYEANNKTLNWQILKTCEKVDFAKEKAIACKEHNVDMKVAFSKEIIKAADIVVE